jgi:hypothetical protein
MTQLQIAPVQPAPVEKPSRPARKPFLGKRSRRTLRALAEVVAPQPPGLPVDHDAIVEMVDVFVAEMPRFLQVAFPIGLWLLEIGTRIWGGTLRRFSKLDRARRDRYVRGWVRSRLGFRRDLIKGVKGLILFAFYSDRRVHPIIGYEGPRHAELVAAERLVRHAGDI